MTTTVIFDLDGVLVDSRAVFLSCVNYAFDKLGLAQREAAELLPYIGPPFAYAFGELLGVPPDAPVVAACIDGYRERYKTASLTETTVEPGIPEALAALDGHRLAVATSKPYAFAEPLLEAMGLREHFEVIAGPDLSARAEDKTRTLGRALRQLGPTRAVMVGDRSFDILAAQAHGLPSIGVTWGIGTSEELRDAGADRLIATPAELPATASVLLGQ
jgi:phosphoglycolate phosphatase